MNKAPHTSTFQIHAGGPGPEPQSGSFRPRPRAGPQETGPHPLSPAQSRAQTSANPCTWSRGRRDIPWQLPEPDPILGAAASSRGPHRPAVEASSCGPQSRIKLGRGPETWAMHDLTRCGTCLESLPQGDGPAGFEELQSGPSLPDPVSIVTTDPAADRRASARHPSLKMAPKPLLALALRRTSAHPLAPGASIGWVSFAPSSAEHETSAGLGLCRHLEIHGAIWHHASEQEFPGGRADEGRIWSVQHHTRCRQVIRRDRHGRRLAGTRNLLPGLRGIARWIPGARRAWSGEPDETKAIRRSASWRSSLALFRQAIPLDAPPPNTGEMRIFAGRNAKSTARASTLQRGDAPERPG